MTHEGYRHHKYARWQEAEDLPEHGAYWGLPGPRWRGVGYAARGRRDEPGPDWGVGYLGSYGYGPWYGWGNGPWYGEGQPGRHGRWGRHMAGGQCPTCGRSYEGRSGRLEKREALERYLEGLKEEVKEVEQEIKDLRSEEAH